MRLIAWNCRGLARTAAANSLRALERKFHPDILFLSETKVSSSFSLLNRFGFVNAVECPANRRKGGVILAWKNGVNMEVVSCTDNIISALVHSDPPDQSWMMTSIYAPLDWGRKEFFW